MTDQSPTRLGQVNGAGDADALFLKVFGGETMAAFAEANVALALTSVRTIKSGKSAQFPAFGKNTASYHTPGQMIQGNDVLRNERVITIDDLLISPVFIANIDEAKNHYDVRQPLSRECGFALSNTLDRNLFQVCVLAARASATVSGGNGGTAITDGDFATSADSILGTAFEAAANFDAKDVPENDRSFVLKPVQYYLLVQSNKAIGRDYNDASNGSMAKGKVMEAAGMKVVKSNHIPTTVISTGPTAYQGTFTNTLGVALHTSAVGTVKLLDLAVESEYQISRQGTLVVAKYAMGHGILRPEAAQEIKTA